MGLNSIQKKNLQLASEFQLAQLVKSMMIK